MCRVNAMVVLLTTIFIDASCTGSSNRTIPDLINSVFDGYDKQMYPNYGKYGEEAKVTVQLNIYIVNVFSISEANMEYSMSMFLRERWVDGRLAYTPTPNVTRLELDTSLMDRLWFPDMYIFNEKKSNFHDVTVPNRLLHIYPNGTVQSSIRVTGTFSCDMSLQSYPFDRQQCDLMFESYGQSTAKMRFAWTRYNDSVLINKDIQFPQFSITDIKEFLCDRDYYGIQYPCIGVSFVLVRDFVYFLLQIYVPSIMVVVLSWLNFWLDCEAVPARITMGLLTVLTITTQISGTRGQMPRVSYIKAIDVWMGTCLVFVFAALIEFAYVNVLCRKEKRQMEHLTVPANNNQLTKQSGDKDLTEEEEETEHKVWRRWRPRFITCLTKMEDIEKARVVDKVSRVLFPLTFLVFNVIYWLSYLYTKQTFADR